MYFILFLKSIFLYIILYIWEQIEEKRKSSAADMIIFLSIAEYISLALLNQISLISVLICMISFVFLHKIMPYILEKWNQFFSFQTTKTVLIRDGKLLFNTMKDTKYSLEQLIENLKKQGIDSIEEVECATLEKNGTLSITSKPLKQPVPIILDGVIQNQVVKKLGKDEIWVSRILKQNKLTLNDVFYAFYTSEKTFIITKTDS